MIEEMSSQQSWSPADDEVRIVVLAGGESRRMGQDKSVVPLLGRPLCEWVTQAARSAGRPVSVLREDAVPGLGPLGGMKTAFDRYPEEWLVFLSCDAPFVTGEAVTSLIREGIFHLTAAGYVVDDRAGFPLILARQHLPVLERQLASGLLSVRRLLACLPCREIKVPPDERNRFFNVNTPGDLMLAQRLAGLYLQEPKFRPSPSINDG